MVKEEIYNKKIEKELDAVKHKILVDMISYSSIKSVEVKGPFGFNNDLKVYINIKIVVKTLTDIDMVGIEEMIFKNATDNLEITMLIPDTIVKSSSIKKGYKNFKNKNVIVFYLEHKNI